MREHLRGATVWGQKTWEWRGTASNPPKGHKILKVGGGPGHYSGRVPRPSWSVSSPWGHRACWGSRRGGRPAGLGTPLAGRSGHMGPGTRYGHQMEQGFPAKNEVASGAWEVPWRGGVGPKWNQRRCKRNGKVNDGGGSGSQLRKTEDTPLSAEGVTHLRASFPLFLPHYKQFPQTSSFPTSRF